MGKYIFAPAGSIVLESNILNKCVEYIGSTQAGFGSNLSKGKRYLKSKLNCSGKAIKRALIRRPKVFEHDFATYGLDVYYYHVDFCDKIIQEIINFIYFNSNDDVKKTLFGMIPPKEQYLDLLYKNRIFQLHWVVDENYKNQNIQAQNLIDKFSLI